jgi:NADPH:quinone reductase
MRAIQFSAYGSYDTLQLVELPQPIPEPGHIVVKMTAAAINPLDNLLRQGRVSFGQHPPLILGNEGAGVIATEGSDLPVGTRVMLRRAYHLPRGEIWGTWQEYVLAPRQAVEPLPDGTSDLEAAALRSAYETAYMALTYRGGFQPGQVVFAPAVGSSVANAVIQLGRILGAERVITTASSSAKARYARGLGYEDVIDLSQESIRDGIAHLTKNAGVDLVIDGMGGDMTTQGLASLKREGTLVLLGDQAGREVRFEIARDFVSKNARIVAHQTAFAPQEVADEAFQTYFTWWTQGRIKPIIARTFPLEQAVEAQRYQVEGRPFGKVLLTFE